MDDREACALIAGTLALMTHFVESRCPHGAGKICENLLRLCALQTLPWELRVVLAKLGARWTLLECGASPSADPAAVRH